MKNEFVSIASGASWKLSLDKPKRPRRHHALMLTVVLHLLGAGGAAAYTNEVYKVDDMYHWKVDDVEAGSTDDLATAITECVGDGNRDVHVLTGGDLSKTVILKPGTVLRCHNNTFKKLYDGYGASFHIVKYGGKFLTISDMTLDATGAGGWGLSIHEMSDVTLDNIKIIGCSIGARIDSHGSRPGTFTVYRHKYTNLTFENCSSHGLETYGVDGIEIGNIVCRNNGGCGVLLNRTFNGTVASVDSYRSPASGGYAGFRCANGCYNLVVDYVKAEQCGRGIFILSGSHDIQIKDCLVRDTVDIGIWIESCPNTTVEAGWCSSGVSAYGEGAYANVKIPNGIYRVMNRKSGKAMQAAGAGTSNGTQIDQWSYSGGSHQRWTLTDRGGQQLSMIGVQSGKAIDITGQSTAAGALVKLYSYWGGGNQKFTFIPTSSRFYRIRPVHAPDKYVEIVGASTADGAKVNQWSFVNGAHQEWSLHTAP